MELTRKTPSPKTGIKIAYAKSVPKSWHEKNKKVGIDFSRANLFLGMNFSYANFMKKLHYLFLFIFLFLGTLALFWCLLFAKQLCIAT